VFFVFKIKKGRELQRVAAGVARSI